MEALPSQHRARTAPLGWAPEVDWRRYRPVIAELYQHKPLKEVMEMMETQHGFKATLKMYKTRIKQRRLDKKNKESDMKAIVRKRDQRLNEGKSSAFHVRGRVVDFEEVVRYWGRRGISVEDIVAQRDASATPTDVKCSTPLVSRIATPVHAPMTTPDALAIPEQTLILIQDYVKGSFDSGNWIRTHPSVHCYSIRDGGKALADIDMIEDSCGLACDLFSRRHFQEAGATLIHATAAVKQIALAEHPHTLIRLLEMFRHCLFEGRHEIGLAIFRHVSDSFADILGPLHRSSLDVSTYNAQILSATNNAQACQRLKKLFAELQNTLDSHDNRMMEARRKLMDLCFIGGDEAEAERHAWTLIAYADEIEDAATFPSYRVFGLQMIANCQFVAGQIESAIMNLNQALELYGRHDSWARILLMNLEKWNLQSGNDEAAVQARNKWLAILETQNAAGLI